MPVLLICLPSLLFLAPAASGVIASNLVQVQFKVTNVRHKFSGIGCNGLACDARRPLATLQANNPLHFPNTHSTAQPIIPVFAQYLQHSNGPHCSVTSQAPLNIVSSYTDSHRISRSGPIICIPSRSIRIQCNGPFLPNSKFLKNCEEPCSGSEILLLYH